MPKLAALDVRYCSVSNILSLKNATELVSLDLRDNPLGDSSVDSEDGQSKSNLEVLANLNMKHNLKKLYLGGSGTSITDYSKISSLNWDEKDGF